jgi:hypothetical protein
VYRTHQSKGLPKISPQVTNTVNKVSVLRFSDNFLQDLLLECISYVEAMN